MQSLTTVPLMIIDDFGIRKLPLTAAEDLLEIVMRRYERASTLLTSNRPVEDWGKLLGDTAAVSAILDRLLHHGHVLKCGRAAGAPRMHLLHCRRRNDDDEVRFRSNRGAERGKRACPAIYGRVTLVLSERRSLWPVLK
jgi:hypothetical protein